MLLDDVPANGETWFLARTFEALRREDLVGVLSFSDPVPRETADGRRMFPGHIGTIYQAHNAAYLGRGTARTLLVLPDGHVLNARAIQKLRARECGWQYVAVLLERYGAEPVGGDLGAWARTWVPRLTRRLRHPGNYRYGWTLHARHRELLVGRPYPKAILPLTPAGIGA